MLNCIPRHEDMGGWRIIATTALNEVELSASRLGRFVPGE
jgi:hypothetical protein